MKLTNYLYERRTLSIIRLQSVTVWCICAVVLFLLRQKSENHRFKNCCLATYRIFNFFNPSTHQNFRMAETGHHRFIWSEWLPYWGTWNSRSSRKTFRLRNMCIREVGRTFIAIFVHPVHLEDSQEPRFSSKCRFWICLMFIFCTESLSEIRRALCCVRKFTQLMFL